MQICENEHNQIDVTVMCSPQPALVVNKPKSMVRNPRNDHTSVKPPDAKQ